MITGASRGVGAAAAVLLAQRGFDIAVNYHSKRSRAEAVVAGVRALQRRALLVQADITSSSDAEAMIGAVGREFGRLDALILNASGGLEKGKPADYAMQLNLTAQVRLVDLALEWLRRALKRGPNWNCRPHSRCCSAVSLFALLDVNPSGSAVHRDPQVWSDAGRSLHPPRVGGRFPVPTRSRQ